MSGFLVWQIMFRRSFLFSIIMEPVASQMPDLQITNYEVLLVLSAVCLIKRLVLHHLDDIPSVQPPGSR